MKYRIQEELLHYIWRVHAFDLNNLKTESGHDIEILSWGHINDDAGPDFLNGKIKIGDTVWAGHIEIHLRASDWRRHNHTTDPQYHNVILHVVYHADEIIKHSDGFIIPCLSLESRIYPELLKSYEMLMKHENWIPCQDHIDKVPLITINSAIEKMVASRLDIKAHQLEQDLKQLKGDIFLLILQQLAWALGLRVNGQAMKLLVQSIPSSTLQRHKDDQMQIDALLFGQAGLIPENNSDDYVNSLQREYRFLQTKFSLTPISGTIWKYHRLRPAAFPTIRIAQLSKLLHSVERFDLLLLNGNINEIQNALNIQVGGYWKYHYTWNSPSPPRMKRLGQIKRSLILINAVVPILWFYGTYRNVPEMKKKALELLEEINGEKNHIVKKWEAIGIQSNTAFETQGLLHLHKHFCKPQKCLQCSIGHSVLSK